MYLVCWDGNAVLGMAGTRGAAWGPSTLIPRTCPTYAGARWPVRSLPAIPSPLYNALLANASPSTGTIALTAAILQPTGGPGPSSFGLGSVCAHCSLASSSSTGWGPPRGRNHPLVTSGRWSTNGYPSSRRETRLDSTEISVA